MAMTDERELNGFEDGSIDELVYLDDEDDIDIDLGADQDDSTEDDYFMGEMGGTDGDYDESFDTFNAGPIDENLEENVDSSNAETEYIDETEMMSDDNEYIIEDDRESLVDDYGNIKVMSGDGDAFRFEYIDIDNILVGERIRRNGNAEAITMSVKSTGLLLPIVVVPTATEGMYALVKGLKRLVACAKSGIRRIPCIINVKAKTTELKVLEAMYNHYTPYGIKDILDFIDYLEKDKGINKPATIEYLMQLDPGDYTKLKDIMNDNDEDIVTPLLNGQMNIGSAFKKLESRRKKETREEKENKKAAEMYNNTDETGASDIAGVGEIGDEDVRLTEQEMAELGFSQDNLDAELDESSIEDLLKEGNSVEGFEPNKQDYKNREMLDPTLRKSVLARDDNQCRICKMIAGQEYVQCLDVHHIHEVYLGGTDDIDNLITACTVCHKLVHLYGRGELYMRPIEEMSEEEQEKFKRVIKLGTVIRKDMALKGMKVKDLKAVDNTETIGRTKPGTGQVAG